MFLKPLRVLFEFLGSLLGASWSLLELLGAILGRLGAKLCGLGATFGALVFYLIASRIPPGRVVESIGC